MRSSDWRAVRTRTPHTMSMPASGALWTVVANHSESNDPHETIAINADIGICIVRGEREHGSCPKNRVEMPDL